MIEQSKLYLNKFVDDLQAGGHYTFTRQGLAKKLNKTDTAITLALNRLLKTGRIISPKRGFYVVVPLEYSLSGGLSPLWYIKDLANYLDCSYYVGLLSAAEIYGAAHQRPQEFQVMTDTQQSLVKLKQYRIKFFHKWNLKETPTLESKVATGSVRVSTPEATALDLVRYYKDVGSLNNVATVLSELTPSIHKLSLAAAAKKHIEMSVIQRLGYLLDLVGQDKLSEGLVHLLKERRVQLAKLRPDLDAEDAKIDSRWSLYVNEIIEPDL